MRIASRSNTFGCISSFFRGIPCCLCFPSWEPRHQSRFFDLAIPISICSHRSTHPNSWLIVVGIGGNEYMGNGLACMPKKDLRGGIGSRSRRGSNSRSQRKTAASEDELLHHQALAMAIHQHQLSQRFDGSMSRRIGSTSSRRRDLPDSVTNGKLVILHCIFLVFFPGFLYQFNSSSIFFAAVFLAIVGEVECVLSMCA